MREAQKWAFQMREAHVYKLRIPSQLYPTSLRNLGAYGEVQPVFPTVKHPPKVMVFAAITASGYVWYDIFRQYVGTTKDTMNADKYIQDVLVPIGNDLRSKNLLDSMTFQQGK